MRLLFDGSVLSVATVELIAGEDVDLDVVESPEDKEGTVATAGVAFAVDVRG